MTEAPPIEPVGPGERIEALDILRGFALWGILWVNLEDLCRAPVGPVDGWVYRAMVFFAQGNFYPLFSFLFGMGFAVQMMRAEKRNVSFVWFFLRRMTALLLIGAAMNVLLENRDILMRYAIFGVPLLLFRRAPTRTLWIAALVFILAAAVYPDVDHARGQRDPAEPMRRAQRAARSQEFRALAVAGDYAGLVRYRWRELTDSFPPRFLNWGQLNLLGIFLLGLYAVRRRLLQAPPPGFLEKAFRWCLGIGILGGVLELERYRWFPGFLPLAFSLPVRGLMAVGAVALSLAYAAAAVWMLARPRLRRFWRPLAPFGRMALTNYILESVFITTIGYGYGFEQIGRLRASAALLLSVAFVAVQVPVSAWWLGRFRYGPAEWLWRSMTYGRVQPFRLPAAGPLQEGAT